MRDRSTDDTRTLHSRRALLAAGGAAGTALLGGCLGGGGDPGSESGSGGDTTTDAAGTDWQSVELDEVRGGETFTIAGLQSPTIVHSFAVWCPKCERLSNQLTAIDGEYTILGLNTDPNEDAAKVREYAEENDFGWRFAVAPTDLTDALVAEFGSTVVNAPSTPVIVVCGDGSTTFLSGGDSTRPTITNTAEGC
ncbi:TlpA family protein disulfide reductase [Halobellus ruber]|uniref:TlpA family protein disulfide reductase n=1 Tax=Halobellus ruber TaxID=2761102 RepID=A0A7J9SIT3_9EURY|nr:TlpA family protein disulfide reductase [Halobellus ruber]MBB6644911.1 TlpA family protein disulfide reductase [Halobellus ruber]